MTQTETTATFADLQFKPHRIGNGVMARHSFDNGYGVSVVRFHGSYGGDDGKYELAVLRDDKLTYDTPVTDDVLGWLSEDDVTRTMAQVAALPAA